MALSRSQLDKLGERLKSGGYTADDVRALDEYRRSFAATSNAVLLILRDDFGLTPTARPAKSTEAIVDKLLRLSTQLTRIQDIAGCRVVVDGLFQQQLLMTRLCDRFPRARRVDRVAEPSFGYRAMHAIVQLGGRWVEIQVRTELQHLWAVLSEKVADRFGHAIKYGHGDAALAARMAQLSDAAYHVDGLQDFVRLVAERVKFESEDDENLRNQLEAERVDLIRDRRILADRLRQFSDNPDALLDET
jgi:ppGpp synthetase/RelA/SpoT-type nucleotidyltranferase